MRYETPFDSAAVSAAHEELENIQNSMWAVRLQILKAKGEHGIMITQMQDADDGLKDILDGPLADAEILIGDNANSEAS